MTRIIRQKVFYKALDDLTALAIHGLCHVNDKGVSLRAAIAITLVVFSLSLLVALWPSAVTNYQGKPLKQWLELYESSSMNAKPSPQAEHAIRQIGTNALPTLIRMIQARDSFIKKKLMDLAAKQHFVNLNLTRASDLRAQGQYGYLILGASAKAQVPELIPILTNDSVAQVRMCAATALGSIGEEARSAATALLVSAKDRDNNVRNNSLWALSRIHADPALVLPGLIEGLNDSDRTARENAAIALARYGTLATSAVPTLTRTANINSFAHQALLQIDPAAISPTKGK